MQLKAGVESNGPLSSFAAFASIPMIAVITRNMKIDHLKNNNRRHIYVLHIYGFNYNEDLEKIIDKLNIHYQDNILGRIHVSEKLQQCQNRRSLVS